MGIPIFCILRYLSNRASLTFTRCFSYYQLTLSFLCPAHNKQKTISINTPPLNSAMRSALIPSIRILLMIDCNGIPIFFIFLYFFNFTAFSSTSVAFSSVAPLFFVANAATRAFFASPALGPSSGARFAFICFFKLYHTTQPLITHTYTRTHVHTHTYTHTRTHTHVHTHVHTHTRTHTHTQVTNIAESECSVESMSIPSDGPESSAGGNGGGDEAAVAPTLFDRCVWVSQVFTKHNTHTSAAIIQPKWPVHNGKLHRTNNWIGKKSVRGGVTHIRQQERTPATCIGAVLVCWFDWLIWSRGVDWLDETGGRCDDCTGWDWPDRGLCCCCGTCEELQKLRSLNPRTDLKLLNKILHGILGRDLNPFSDSEDIFIVSLQLCGVSSFHGFRVV